MLLGELNNILRKQTRNKTTDSHTYLHQIAEKLKRRSLIFLFTDMFQDDKNEIELFEALKHLKYNKHEVVLFHVVDKKGSLISSLIMFPDGLPMWKPVRILIYMRIISRNLTGKL